VPVGADADWIAYGWGSFKDAPLPWIGILVVFVLVSGVLGIIPLLGTVVNGVLGPVLMAGIYLACDGQRREGTLDFARLFGGFSTHATALLALGAVNLVFTAIVQVGMAVALFGPADALEGLAAMEGVGSQPTPDVDVGRMVGIGLLLFAVSVPCGFALWQAPALVAINGVAPIEALRLSLLVCLRNFGSVFVYGLMLIGVAVVATLPCGLGWLVALPVMFAGQYAAYRSFYFR
jgi:uncharacterized membrane protein